MPFSGMVLPSLFRELYLDTNVWSELAKGHVRADRIVQWMRDNAGYLALSRFQAIELSRSPRVVQGLVDRARNLRIVLVDRGFLDYPGRTRWATGAVVFMQLDLSDESHREVVRDELLRGPIVRAGEIVRKDASKLRLEVEEVLASALIADPWRHFPERLDRWVLERCTAHGVKAPEGRRRDSERYRGMKLQFAMLFARFVVQRARWQDSAYLDYLHCGDMGYADAVVTERGMASAFNESDRHSPGIAPPEVYTMDWLR